MLGLTPAAEPRGAEAGALEPRRLLAGEHVGDGERRGQGDRDHRGHAGHATAGASCSPLVFWVGRHVTSTLEEAPALSFIHYARWVVIRRFPDGGRGERLGHTYLFFESNFNGTWDQYIDAFSEVVPSAHEGDLGHAPTASRARSRSSRSRPTSARTSTSPTTTGRRIPGRRRPRSSRPSASPRRSTTSAALGRASTPTRSPPPTARCSPTSSATCEARAPQPLGPGLRADRADPDPRRRGQRARRAPRHLRPGGREPAARVPRRPTSRAG